MVQVRINYPFLFYLTQEFLSVTLFSMLKSIKFGLDSIGSFAMVIDGIEQLKLYSGARGPDPRKVNFDVKLGKDGRW